MMMENSNFPPVQNDAGKYENDQKLEEASPETLAGVGEVLWKAQEDIKQMKEEILREAGNDELATERLKGIIEKVENNIKRQTEDVVKSVNNKCSTISQEPKTSKSAVLSPKKVPQSPLANNVGHTAKGKPVQAIGPGTLPPGQQFLNFQKLKSIINPLSADARKLLNQKYSVPLPIEKDRQDENEEKEGAPKGQILKPQSFKADLTKGPVIYGTAKDPNAAPKMTADDAKQGMLYLVERHFIPPCAKVNLDPQPVQSKQSKLFPLSERSQDYDAFVARPIAKDNEEKKDLTKAVATKDADRGATSPSRVTFKQQQKSKTMQQEPKAKSDFIFGNKGEVKQQSTLTDSASTSIRGLQAVVPHPTPTFDDKSTRRFMIQNGKARCASADFIKFKEFYQSSWGSIVSLLIKMEKFLLSYSIPIAIIDGDQFVDLALYFEGNLTPTKEDLMTCILNRDDVSRFMMIPGRRYIAADGLEVAATKIQSSFRKYRDRVAYLQYRRGKWAAGLLALNWIMICKIALIKKQLKLAREKHLERYRIRAKTLKQSWEKLQTSKRVLIHIPSLGYTQQVRDNLPDIRDMENQQVGRIFEVFDPNVEVIYIWPWQLNDDTEKYYKKFLDMVDKEGDNSEPASRRCTIMSPDAGTWFPTHNMCLSTLLKYSTKTLNRIKSLIKGRNAYIVPGLMHTDDLQVADFLDVPVLGCEPEIAGLYSSKSGARRIFEDADVDRGPSDADIYTMHQLHESLSSLVAENLHTKRWLFKIDDEIHGRGIAYCDVVTHLTFYAWAQKEAERYGEKWAKKWAREVVYSKILQEIPEILEKHAIVIDKRRFISWKKFLDEYFSKGGIIEACPPSDSITSLSLDLLIDPCGNCEILSAADQIHGLSPYRCLGYTFPQLSVEPNVLQKIADDICVSCKNRGIMGYLSINFVTFIDPFSMKQRVWPVGLDLSYSTSLSSFQVFRHITGGSFSFANNSFQAPVLVKNERSPYRKNRRRPPPPKQVKYEQLHRFAVYSTALHHENLRSIQSRVLFQLCKSHGIGYDVKAKIGTVFTVIDQLTKETFGVLTVGESMQQALSSFALNLSLIHRDISTGDKQTDTNIQDILQNIQLILNMTAANSQPQEAIPFTPNHPKPTPDSDVADQPIIEVANYNNPDVNPVRIAGPSPVTGPGSPF